MVPGDNPPPGTPGAASSLSVGTDARPPLPRTNYPGVSNTRNFVKRTQQRVPVPVDAWENSASLRIHEDMEQELSTKLQALPWSIPLLKPKA